MKNYIFSVWLIFTSFVLIQFGFHSYASAQIKRHMVIYGGFKDTDVYRIAKNIDILIVGKVSYFQLKQLKQVNPDLIILKYYHCIGIYKGASEWNIVNQHEDWFVHDKSTDRRLTQKNRGWYLLNIANDDWRKFVSNKIAGQTESLFDGIFIDGYWHRFVRKFVAEGMKQAALPAEDFVINWIGNMTALLKQIRTVYPKLIFINGAHEEYIDYVDGCMEEAFIHSNWSSDTKYSKPSDYVRTLKKIQDIAKYGKVVLAQSGTRGDLIATINDIYRLCFASYLIAWDKNISFNFHPRHTYSFGGLYQINDYELDLGRPLGDYYVERKGVMSPNLLPNGNFNKGLRGWKVISGNPSPDSYSSISGQSIRFKGSVMQADKIVSEFISVKEGTDYTISAFVKSKKNISVNKRYQRLGLQGRFYDKYKKRITGGYSLNFSAGTYDWLPFETTHTSPSNAAYFQMKLGFSANGFGEGWIDNLYFGVSTRREMIYRRDFSKGSVFVNYGNKTATVELKKNNVNNTSKYITIKAREGKIIQYRKP